MIGFFLMQKVKISSCGVCSKDRKHSLVLVFGTVQNRKDKLVLVIGVV